MHDLGLPRWGAWKCPCQLLPQMVQTAISVYQTDEQCATVRQKYSVHLQCFQQLTCFWCCALEDDAAWVKAAEKQMFSGNALSRFTL